MGILEFNSRQLEEMRAELEGLRRENERLVALAYRDPLTGLRNRRCFSERLAEEICRSQRHRAPVSVLCLDVNGFKHLNDTLGHAAGDSALVGVGEFLETLTRAEDLCCRIGGDEFAVLLPDTDTVQCRFVTQRIRARVGELSAFGLHQGLSIGAAMLGPGDDEASLIARADQEMYADKRAQKRKRAPAEDSGHWASAV
jgi:diguanylate cyclase (GGDEF)-like protein